MYDKKVYMRYSESGEFMVAISGGWFESGVSFRIVGRPLHIIPDIKTFGDNMVFNGDSPDNRVPLRMIVI